VDNFSFWKTLHRHTLVSISILVIMEPNDKRCLLSEGRGVLAAQQATMLEINYCTKFVKFPELV
jgi:hypothetical protein